MTNIPVEATDPTTTLPEEVEVDPYRYGWRYVKQTQPDGTYSFEIVPLTLDDVLHPEEEDFIVQSSLHNDVRTYLRDVFRAQVAQDPTAVVLSDCRVAWDVPELRPNGPDLAVIFGVRERRNWSTFDVAVEGVRPALIVEITSPETRALDLVDKFEDYDMAGIPLYAIVDIVKRRDQSRTRLLGYYQTADGYQVLAPDERGWLWLDPVQVWLGLRDNQVVCADAQGNLIGDYVAVAERAEAAVQAQRAAEELADAETQARRAAEAQVRAEIQARLAAEAQVDAETQARLAAEAQVRAEAQTRLAVEARLRELETELQRFRSAQGTGTT